MSESTSELPEVTDAGGSFWKELPFLVIIALVLALLIKTFLVQAFYIPSASMEDTLQGGPEYPGGPSKGHPYDRVLVNKLVYRFRSVHRGEIIVFRKPPGWPNESSYQAPSNPVLRFFHGIGSAIGVAPSGGSDFIKRVVGVGGDHVMCCNESKQVVVNGHPLVEPYIDLTTRDPADHAKAYTPFDRTVPKGELFVMGDHRDDSADSRYYGFVPTSDVIGRAFVVIWPVADWKTLGVPSTFKQAGLAATASPYFPVVSAAVVVTPAALLRRRRRRRSRAT
ncbi:MAG: signal peptidase I [Frankiaceae bacterium]|nr:signal peptidase I [Frankiaceae bacterium]MBV9869414.1 signal peptidase I [Frankiaceae bacterium]